MTAQQWYSENPNKAVLGAWFALTSILLFRVSRQPISTARKWEQGETIFKGTALGAVILGIGLNGGFNRRRSELKSTEDSNVRAIHGHDREKKQ